MSGKPFTEFSYIKEGDNILLRKKSKFEWWISSLADRCNKSMTLYRTIDIPDKSDLGAKLDLSPSECIRISLTCDDCLTLAIRLKETHTKFSQFVKLTYSSEGLLVYYGDRFSFSMIFGREAKDGESYTTLFYTSILKILFSICGLFTKISLILKKRDNDSLFVIIEEEASRIFMVVWRYDLRTWLRRKEQDN